MVLSAAIIDTQMTHYVVLNYRNHKTHLQTSPATRGQFMKERNSLRYNSKLLPKNLSRVTITWGIQSFESEVVNCCAHGIRVSFPPLGITSDLPKKNDTVKVLISPDHIWITGMCIYVTTEPDGATSMGIYFYHPSEQNYLNYLLSSTLNILPQPDTFVCHEWEEFVEKLYNSEDPNLKEIGQRELGMLRAKGEGVFPPDRQ
jgi:hypothetical protein